MFSFLKNIFSKNHKERNLFQHTEQILRRFVYIVVILGGTGLILYSTQPLKDKGGIIAGFSIISSGLMFAAASFLVGSLLGFLFGVPRALQRPENKQKSDTQATDGQARAKESPYEANTNLEQISDWLTKILVGVGLTQLTAIQEKLSKIGDLMAPALGGFSSSKPFAVSIFVFFLICGFLLTYLWARIYLQRAFTEGEAEEMLGKVDQSEADRVALALVAKQLDRNTDSPGVNQQQLNKSIKAASVDYARLLIFYQAQNVRALNWRDKTTKPFMERTIPVFRALIESDTEQKYHRNHGQLGYALKDQCVPSPASYGEAEKELTVAIEIRDKTQDKGYVMYEFNRAVCRIMLELDPSSKEAKPSTPETKEKILNDLKAGATAKTVKDIILQEENINKWMASNGVTADNL